MENFKFSDGTPMAALTIGQFKELLNSMMIQQVQYNCQPVMKESLPDTFGKAECSKFIGYAVNTINKMICEKEIPYFKNRGKVIFKRDEIQEWMLSNRVRTTKEFIAQQEIAINKKMMN